MLPNSGAGGPRKRNKKKKQTKKTKMDHFAQLVRADNDGPAFSDSETDDYSDDEVEEGKDGYRLGGYHRVEIGDVYNRRYTVVSKLGWGHFSTVWLCRDRETNQPVALKVQKAARHYLEAAKDEIDLLKRVEKNNAGKQRFVTRLLDSFSHFGPNGEHVCMVFEVFGVNLLDIIRHFDFTGIPISIVKIISKQVLLGLHYLHVDCGIIHTDLKPENVLLMLNEGPNLEKHEAEMAAAHPPQAQNVVPPEFLAKEEEALNGITGPARKKAKQRFRIKHKKWLEELKAAAEKERLAKEEEKRKKELEARAAEDKKKADAPTISGYAIKLPADKCNDPSNLMCLWTVSGHTVGVFKHEDHAAEIVNTIPGSKLFPMGAKKLSFVQSTMNCSFIDNDTETSVPNKEKKNGSTPRSETQRRELKKIYYTEEALHCLGHNFQSFPEESELDPCDLTEIKFDEGIEDRFNTIVPCVLPNEIMYNLIPSASDIDIQAGSCFDLQLTFNEEEGGETREWRCVCMGPDSANTHMYFRQFLSHSVPEEGFDNHLWYIYTAARDTEAVLDHIESHADVAFIRMDHMDSLSESLRKTILDGCSPAHDAEFSAGLIGLNIKQILHPNSYRFPSSLHNRLFGWTCEHITPTAEENHVIHQHHRLLDNSFWSREEKIGCVIADLGNACWVNNHFTNNIQTRQYRSPEVLIESSYNETADIWSCACMIFELLTGDLLFQPKESKTGEYERDEDHLALMSELLGRIPRHFALSGHQSRRFFNRNGELKHIHQLNFWRISDVLHEKYSMDRTSADAVESFLKPMLEFDPLKRASAADCLKHSWLQDVDCMGFPEIYKAVNIYKPASRK
eukprot:TRINITY_DN2674_c0_g1_i1.p1 TRINITY_DN2674_c0_g1~~TRINITY_DN2674_c0_g1_i1.p1  ORF type:complete len:849 (-),score=235.13 TRINITY_DN2674_c0_g1_i1:252-2798(-)